MRALLMVSCTVALENLSTIRRNLAKVFQPKSANCSTCVIGSDNELANPHSMSLMDQAHHVLEVKEVVRNLGME